MLELDKTYNMNCIKGLKLIDDESIDCCVTSPPYWQLRDYGHKEQIGLEKTITEYEEKLVQVFSEIKRVLKPTGTVWINMGDTYCSTAPGTMGDNLHIKECKEQTKRARKLTRPQIPEGLKPKDLIGIPWRIAFALQYDGWWLRQDIIWDKTNCMPESVKDRCTKSHEYIFLLSKSSRYFYDNEIIKEDCVNGDALPPRGSKGVIGNQHKGNRKTFRGGGTYTNHYADTAQDLKDNEQKGNSPNKQLKRNCRSVWRIATAQHRGIHFATFPEELAERCLLAGCPINGIVIDPFMGSGTVAKKALENNRHFIGFDVNPKYTEMSNKRISIIQPKLII